MSSNGPAARQMSNNNHADSSEPRVPVHLNVYNMFWTNEYTDVLGLGVYHSGIHVYGDEYCYGGQMTDGSEDCQFIADCSSSGIFRISPRNSDGELGDQFQLKETHFLGFTSLAMDEILQIIEQMGKEFQSSQYHILNKNCNHFSEALSSVLCSKSIPKYVNRLANVSKNVPFIEKALPKEWFNGGQGQQSNDGGATASNQNGR